MRSGGITLQQSLTAEAASVLKQSLSLARRRGHAQVTPLHVASTLLTSSRPSLFKTACLLNSPLSPHPLHSRALELCFNVALNRLPTTTTSPLLTPHHHHHPSLSNALIAALKRAQAHQRRGSIEQHHNHQNQHQQPLLTIKVALEQLIISILDDPSVSRVMREAGFSSTCVKSNIEDSSASSFFHHSSINGGGVFSTPSSPPHRNTNFWQTHFFPAPFQQNPLFYSPPKRENEDINLVLELLSKKNPKRNNTVILADSVSLAETLVAELTRRIERKEVSEDLKSSRLIRFEFGSSRLMKKADGVVEANLLELKRKIESAVSGGEGVIIYAGDLKWIVDEEKCDDDDDDDDDHNKVDQVVSEIGKMLAKYTAKVRLIASASYQTYMRCQMKQPPLDLQWSLQPLSLPSSGLSLSLHASSAQDSRITFSKEASQVIETKPLMSTNKEEEEEEEERLTCCPECSSNYEKEAHLFSSAQHKPLPSWLQPAGSNSNPKDELVDMKRKWNRFCLSLHQGRHNQSLSGSSLYKKSNSYASSYPWWPAQSTTTSSAAASNSISFIDHSPWIIKPHHRYSDLVPKFRRQQSCTIEFTFGDFTKKQNPKEPNLDSLKNTQDKEPKITLGLASSVFSDEKSSEKLRNDLCKLLEENVPWQSESIPSIVEALMVSKSERKEAWFLIQGNDTIGKRRLAHGIAESVFGSADSVLHINMRNRDNEVTPCSSDMIVRALKDHQELVFLIEQVDLADNHLIKCLAEGFQMRNSQAIFILTKDDSSSNEAYEKGHNSVIQITLNIKETTHATKRKIEWDSPHKAKIPRIEENEDASFGTSGSGNISKDMFPRRSSFNNLDLNMKADEDEELEDKPGEVSPISSDLTRETIPDPHAINGFLESIENRFVFYQSGARDRVMKDGFLSMINGAIEEVFGVQNMFNFSVEEKVLEEVMVGSGFFLNSLFKKWVKEVFQSSLERVEIRGKEGVHIRLSFGGKNDEVSEDGFMGSSLPKKIQVSLME